jgi:hypothetical protein
MKEEIIYTDDYALILSDEQTKENDWGYIRFQGGDVKLIGKYFADDWLKVIAHRPLTDAPILEGVPLMPKFTQEDDVVKIADVLKVGSTYRDYEHLVKRGIIIGYNKAKETYKYTEDDLRKVIEASRDIRYVTYSEDELIQSLQQPKRPKYFECEIARITKFNGEPDYFELNSKPNSQGQTELVGEYIF